jgi:hypothetical protein
MEVSEPGIVDADQPVDLLQNDLMYAMEYVEVLTGIKNDLDLSDKSIEGFKLRMENGAQLKDAKQKVADIQKSLRRALTSSRSQQPAIATSTVHALLQSRSRSSPTSSNGNDEGNELILDSSSSTTYAAPCRSQSAPHEGNNNYHPPHQPAR